MIHIVEDEVPRPVEKRRLDRHGPVAPDVALPADDLIASIRSPLARRAFGVPQDGLPGHGQVLDLRREAGSRVHRLDLPPHRRRAPRLMRAAQRDQPAHEPLAVVHMPPERLGPQVEAAHHPSAAVADQNDLVGPGLLASPANRPLELQQDPRPARGRDARRPVPDRHRDDPNMGVAQRPQGRPHLLEAPGRQEKSGQDDDGIRPHPPSPLLPPAAARPSS